MQGHTIHDGRHAELAHAIVDVTARLAFGVAHHLARQVDAQIRCALGVGQVGTREVGAAAQHFRQGRRERFQGQLAGFAAGHGLGLGVGVNDGVDHALRKVLRQIAFHAPQEFGGQRRMRLLVGGKQSVPGGLALLPGLLGVPSGIHRFGDFKGCMGPAERGARQGDFVGPQGLAVGFGGVGPVRAAFADVGLANDQRGLVGAQLGAGNGLGHSRGVMAVHRADHLPAIGLETLGRVVGKPGGHLAVDGNAVVIVQRNQFVQLPGAGQRAGFVADALHQAAVAHEHIGVVVDDGMPWAVEFIGQQFFRQGHAHRIGDALAQRPRGGFHAGGDTHFRVAGGLAVQLAEILQLLHGQVIARQVQQGVNQH